MSARNAAGLIASKITDTPQWVRDTLGPLPALLIVPEFCKVARISRRLFFGSSRKASCARFVEFAAGACEF